jgi:AcrR family transcriptional regulator
MGEHDRDEALEARICAAALTCIGRWGVAKTTLEDVAREAGCGRATIYRTFQGGKAHVLGAVLRRETDRLVGEIDAAVDGAGDRLDDVVVAGVVAAARFLAGHRALGYLLAHEPDLILPHVTFHRLGALFDVVSGYAAPKLAPFLPEPDDAARAAEWLARVVVTYVANPADGADLTDEAAARHLLGTYVLPGLLAARPVSTTPDPVA